MANFNAILFFFLISLVLLVPETETSAGDRSQAFQDCLYFCKRGNCTADEDGLTHHDRTQPLYLKASQWDCEDECKYFCMWYTLDRYARGSYWVPQFYGKVCANGWLCSTIFHARDTSLTEKLDYLGAFAMVLFSFYALLVRIIGLTRKLVVATVSAVFGAFYFHHIYNLLFVSFDYEHNMKINIGVGALQILGWLIWCAVRRKEQRYVWRCAATMLLIIATTLLEVVDFPPLMGLFDAHALWHLSTAALPLLWYRFLIDDSIHLFGQNLSYRKLP